MPFDGSNWQPRPEMGFADVLDHAADLVERGWCQRNLARNWFGWPCSPFSILARRYCARGAIQRALWDLTTGDDVVLRELEIAEEIIVAAFRTPVGLRLMMTREWEYAQQEGAQARPPVELAAIERWNDIDKMEAGEVAHMFRFTAGELRRAE